MAKRVASPRVLGENGKSVKVRYKRGGAIVAVDTIMPDGEIVGDANVEQASSKSYPQRPRRVSQVFYSYEEARELIIDNKILLKSEYNRFRKDHPMLPWDPDVHYGTEFLSWNHFTGRPEFYATLEQAQEAARSLSVKSRASYIKATKIDPRLPYTPENHYKEFPGYEVFLGIGDAPYETYQEASDAAKRLGIISPDAYRRNRKKDPKLIASPLKRYRNEWKGWPHFLQMADKLNGVKLAEESNVYATWEEFSAAVSYLGIKTQSEYMERRVEDARLPVWPERVYLEDWPGWGKAMVGRARFACKTWQEAKAVVLPHRFDGYSAYRVGYKVDTRLPADPIKKYPDFPGWPAFLLPEIYGTLADLKLAIKLLGVKTQDAYLEARSRFPVLPENPEVLFSDEWVDWYDACGFITPYSYQELQSIAQSHDCKTLKDYRKLARKLGDSRMVNRPELHYKEWVSVYDFLSIDLPYLLTFVSKQSAGWIADVAYWLERLPAVGTREYSVCKFIRYYIEPNGYGATVQDFLQLKRVDTVQFEKFIASQGKPASCRRTWYEIQEYLNDALKRHFFDEDESGKIYRTADAANPLAAIKYNGEFHRPSESTKPPLAYQFVKAAKDWIVQPHAKTLRDLVNIHGFDSDYLAVDESMIDFDDPNCVYRKSGDQYYLWIPMYWIAVYTLLSVPARARQVMYNDSGEADEFIVDISNGEPQWVLNTSPMAEKELQQAFVSHDEKGNWGMHFTSNKTSYDGGGYDVPWIPQPLVYWLTVLREWQKKYNPVLKRTRWVDCASRCNFSKIKLKKKPDACFLFRAFGEDKPPVYAGGVASRLAATLYNIQPDDLVLASFDDTYERSDRVAKSTLTRYSSEFTTHSMRVSLITAYVMKFGMPVEIIMKIVGHASIVMTIYYVKVGSASVRQAMTEGEKRALQDDATDMQIMVEQKRLDELQHQMVGSTKEALEALLAGNSGTQLVRDYGMCPYAGARCGDGGESTGKQWLPVQAGHLGLQNCPRCRHFVTGPVFLGGLAALWNEISLTVNLNWQSYADIDQKLSDYRSRLQDLRNEKFDCAQVGKPFNDRELKRINVAIRKLEADQEGVVTKMDMYIGDLQALTKLISECKVLLNTNSQAESPKTDGMQLLVSDRHELEIVYEETSLFHQLNEVCQNATLYQSASAVMATPRRAQLLDRLALNNGIRPVMLQLDEREQLRLGNQVSSFLFSRLKSRKKVDELISGQLRLEDLQGEHIISVKEITTLMSSESLPGLDGIPTGYARQPQLIEVEPCH
jgi:hypothetical protein